MHLSMKSINRVELKCTINSELPRKMVAKGSRSSTRREKKSIVRVASSDIGRVDHVPIEKGRFMVPSPSSKKSSRRRGSSQHSTQINHISRFNQKLNGGGTSDDCDEKTDCNGHGFSGIAILAADCSSDMSKDSAPAVFQQQEPTEKKNKSHKNVRLHWDLNVSMDAWSQPCNVEDDASYRDLEGEITESIVPKESEPIDGSKDHVDGLIASDGQANFSSPSDPKVEAPARNGKECQSCYDLQLEDGEIEHMDEGFYSMVESNDNKMEDSDKGILSEKKFRPVKCEYDDALRIGETNDGSDIEKHVKKGPSSPSGRFVSKPFKELPSHDAIQRRRSDHYKELNMCPYNLFGKDEKSSERRYCSGSGSGPPYYKGGSYGFERLQSKGMMDGFDQSGSGPGLRRKKLLNGRYRGRYRMFSDGGDRDFRGPHGDDNQYPGRIYNRMSGNRRERGNSLVFRRMYYPQSESRYRSRSPVPWNSRNILSPSRDGFRADERMMERERLPFRKQFLAIGSMSPPRNRVSSPRLFERRNHDSGENHNSFRERKFPLGQRLDVENSLRRLNSDNNNKIRHIRSDGAEDNTGRNKFEMAQQKTRRAEITEDGSNDVRRFRFQKTVGKSSQEQQRQQRM